MKQNQLSYTIKTEDVGRDFREIFGRLGQYGRVLQVDIGKMVFNNGTMENTDQRDRRLAIVNERVVRSWQMYDYQTEKPKLFTEDGQEMFLKIRDKVQALLETAGAFKSENAIHAVCGDTWTMLACLDRLVELGEIREITDSSVWGQHKVFVRV